MGTESKFSPERFKETAKRLRSKIDRDNEIHRTIAELPGQLDKMAIHLTKVVRRFVDVITAQHYQMLGARLKRMEKVAGDEGLPEEYLRLLEGISEVANENYGSLEKLEAAIKALDDFEIKIGN